MDLAYRESGAGPPLLVLHGLFGSGRNWHGIARVLAPRFRVLTVDLRNHGDSPHDPRMDYPAMAADVLELMNRLDLLSATVLGHSMGGKAAMLLALEHPRRVQRLVAVDIAPVDYGHHFHDLVDAMQSLPGATLASRRQADACLAGRIPDAPLRQFLLQSLVPTDGGFRWRINLSAIDAHMQAIVGFPALPEDLHYPGPALFIRGARSDSLAAEHEAAVRRRFPGARIETLPGAGHWPHAECPEEFLGRLQPFLLGH